MSREMKKVNFSKIVMEVIITLPQEYQDKLSKVNLEIKDYPDQDVSNTQIISSKSKHSGDIFTNVKSIVLYRQAIIDISYTRSELKENIRFAILSQADEALGLPGHALMYGNSDELILAGYH